MPEERKQEWTNSLRQLWTSPHTTPPKSSLKQVGESSLFHAIQPLDEGVNQADSHEAQMNGLAMTTQNRWVGNIPSLITNECTMPEQIWVVFKVKSGRLCFPIAVLGSTASGACI